MSTEQFSVRFRIRNSETAILGGLKTNSTVTVLTMLQRVNLPHSVIFTHWHCKSFPSVLNSFYITTFRIASFCVCAQFRYCKIKQGKNNP